MNKFYLSFTACALSIHLNAQEVKDTNQIKDVVIQENRMQMPFNQSARNVHMITKEEIAKLPVKTVNELLSYAAGVDLRQRGPMGTQADISIDGGSFEQTMVLLNGVKLMDSQTAHNMLNLPVTLDAIERIEILKGPAARVYGINALTGAVNIVTKKSSQPSISLHTYAGSSFQQMEEGDGKGIYGGGGLQLTANYGNEKNSHLLAISKDKYNGQRYNTAQDNTRLFYNGETRWKDNKHQVAWLASYIHNDFGANGFYAAPGDRESREVVQTALFSLSSKHQIKNWTISPRISNRYNEDDYRYFRHDLSRARSLHYSNALIGELNATVKTKVGVFGLGWESRFEYLNSSNMGEHHRANHGLYGEYKHIFWSKFITNVGAYVNYNTNFGWQVYPGIDAAYLLPKGFKVAVNIGSGQRIPSFTDLYLNQLPGNLGNPNLKPENAWQYEANIQYSKKTLRIKAGYFYRDVNQFIDWVRDSIQMPYSPYNIGRNQIQGINASISQYFTLKNKHRLGYNLSYNFLHPTVDSKTYLSKYVLESLRHQLIAGVNYSISGIMLGINTRWIQRELNDPYFLLDARISYQIKSFQIYSDCTNLLNTQYKEAGAVPMPPRWFSLGVRYQISK